MVEKILYDELAYWDDERKEQFEADYPDEEYDPWIEAEIDFDSMFNNKDANQLYVVCGTAGHWDGVHHGYFDWITHSIKSAILRANSGYGGNITVSEGDYGKLLLRIGHHDGVNNFEIREVTKKGEDVLNRAYSSVEDIIYRQGCTRNVRYSQKYSL